MEGFKYYYEAYATYGSELMEVFEEEDTPKRVNAKGRLHLWKQVMKKLAEVNNWVSYVSLDDPEFENKTELHKKLWDIYAIGVGIVVFLTTRYCNKREIANWKKKDICHAILDSMTEGLPKRNEIQILVNTFFNVTQVLNVHGK